MQFWKLWTNFDVSGRSPLDVRRQLEHSTLKMTDHYASLSIEQLQKSHEKHSARRFIQIADATSKSEGKTISPIELLEEEIVKNERLLAVESLSLDVDLIRKSLNEMRKAVEELRERKNTEHNLIFRDAYQVERDFPSCAAFLRPTDEL